MERYCISYVSELWSSYLSNGPLGSTELYLSAKQIRLSATSGQNRGLARVRSSTDAQLMTAPACLCVMDPGECLHSPTHIGLSLIHI